MPNFTPLYFSRTLVDNDGQLAGTNLQMETLMSGFYEIIPLPEIAPFNERELAFLISGTMEYDLV